MDNNIFMGGGFFGSRGTPVVGPSLGKVRVLGAYGASRPVQFTPNRIQTSYSWNQFSRPINQAVPRVTRPTSQPIAAGESELGCYFCANLGGSPTYWMSGAQAGQWNQDRNAGCEKVSDKECQKKYSQMQANQQASIRRTGFNAFNLPGAANVAQSAFNNLPSSTTFASALSGRIRVQNPELLG